MSEKTVQVPKVDLFWRAFFLFVTCLFVFWFGRISGKRAADRWWQKACWQIAMQKFATEARTDPSGPCHVQLYMDHEGSRFSMTVDDCAGRPGTAENLSVKVKRAKKVRASPNKFSLRGQGGGFRSDDLTVTYYSKIGCAEMKIPCRVMLDIVNAKPGDYGWFHGIASTADVSTPVCALMEIDGFQISRMDDASCYAQDWAAAGGKATVEIKKP